jgi:hypothetical protein
VILDPEGVSGIAAFELQRVTHPAKEPLSAPDSAPQAVTSAASAPLVNEARPSQQPPLAQPQPDPPSQHEQRPADPQAPMHATAPAPASEAVPVAKSTDAERAPGTLNFTQDTYSVAPGEGIARLSVKRRGGSKGAISFRWWTVSGSAQPDRDFVAVQPRSEQMAAGQEQVILFIPVVADATRKGTEYFQVQIDDAEGARLGDQREATVILVGSD